MEELRKEFKEAFIKKQGINVNNPYIDISFDDVDYLIDDCADWWINKLSSHLQTLKGELTKELCPDDIDPWAGGRDAGIEKAIELINSKMK